METLHKLSPVAASAIRTAVAVYGRVFEQAYGRPWNPAGPENRALPINALHIEEDYLEFDAADVYWDGDVFQSTADWTDERWIDWTVRLLDAILGARPDADPSSSNEYRRGWGDAVTRAEKPSTYLGFPQPTGLNWGPDDVVVDGDWLVSRLRSIRDLARQMLGGAKTVSDDELRNLAGVRIPGEC